MTETRVLFWSFDSLEILIFYGVASSFIALFLLGAMLRARQWWKGAGRGISFSAPRFVPIIAEVLSHRRIMQRDRPAGFAHLAIFFGFLTLFIGTTIIFIDYDILGPVLGRSFWQGKFYLVFSLCMDIGGVLLLAGIVYLAARRALGGKPKLNYAREYLGETRVRERARVWRTEDWIFLGWLTVIVLTGYVQEALRLSMDPAPDAVWSPVGQLLSRVIGNFELQRSTMAVIRVNHWWFHALLCLSFIACIPWFKGRHMFTGIMSLSLRNPAPLKRLHEDGGESGEFALSRAGLSRVGELSLKRLIQLDACTKCGKCHEACPARASALPLSPRDLILDLRDLAHTCVPDVTVGTAIADETIWSCMSCGACQEICPVGIEHPPMIVDLRRSLVEAARIPQGIQKAFENVATTGNSFGFPARNRGHWSRELEFEIKNANEVTVDWLWYVGDYASYDPRNQVVSCTVAKLLKAANVDFGILHQQERTAGNDVRRAGEEVLFQELRKQNLSSLSSARPFRNIVTTDPHTFNTMKNEYGHEGKTGVFHYSSLLVELLESGRLKVMKPLGKRVTLHDPCHLGRLNGEYDAPRRVLAAIGCELIEMPRNRDNSFCCGAGGGRIWSQEKGRDERPSEIRIHEAQKIGKIDYFITCCPKDLTMFEDARKTAGAENDFEVKDLAELVADAVELQNLSMPDWNALAQKMAQTLSRSISQSVGEIIDAKLNSLRVSAEIEEKSVKADEIAPRQKSGTKGENTGAVVSGSATPEADPKLESTASADVNAAINANRVDTGDRHREAGSNMASEWSISPVKPAAIAPYEFPPRRSRKILVAVKRVGMVGDDLRIASDERSIEPEVMDWNINEWDETGIEEALLKAEALGDTEVVAVTVGPAAADEILRKALAKGVDRAVRLWSDQLSDGDPMAVARAIAAAAIVEQPDLIIAGAQSSDLGQSATGSVLSRILNLPLASVAIALCWDGGTTIDVTRELEGGVQHHQRLAIPTVVTVQTGMNTPRYSSLRMINQAKSKPIIVSEVDVGASSLVGHEVRKMSVPLRRRTEISEEPVDQVAARIVSLFLENR